MAWVDSLFQRETVPVLQAAMGFGHQRHMVLMNNIANVETPNYKRQDLPESEFVRAVGKAIEERRAEHPDRFALRDTPHVAFESGVYPRSRVEPGREFGPERHDENSVVIEKEMLELSKNGLQLEVLQRLYKNKLNSYRSALRDRVL